MKSLNFVIIGIPASINQESIVTAVALMAKKLGLSEIHTEILETSKFVTSSSNKQMIENILKDVITVCTAAGLMNIAAINANFWKLIEDGKLTRPQIEMMLDEKKLQLSISTKRDALISLTFQYKQLECYNHGKDL